MERFLAETRQVDPDITGYSVNYYEFGLVMQSDFRMAFLYAVIAIVLLLAIDLRRPLDVVFALIPLAIGGIWMVGVMNLIDLEYNLANIMAIPLIVGIGVAYGVYVIHRVRETPAPAAAAGRGDDGQGRAFLRPDDDGEFRGDELRRSPWRERARHHAALRDQLLLAVVARGPAGPAASSPGVIGHGFRSPPGGLP